MSYSVIQGLNLNMEELRASIRQEYSAVANEPKRGFHFHIRYDLFCFRTTNTSLQPIRENHIVFWCLLFIGSSKCPICELKILTSIEKCMALCP